MGETNDLRLDAGAGRGRPEVTVEHAGLVNPAASATDRAGRSACSTWPSTSPASGAAARLRRAALLAAAAVVGAAVAGRPAGDGPAGVAATVQ